MVEFFILFFHNKVYSHGSVFMKKNDSRRGPFSRYGAAPFPMFLLILQYIVHINGSKYNKMLHPLANYAPFARIILFQLVYVNISQNIYGLSPFNLFPKWRFALNMWIFCSYNGQYNNHLNIQFV